MHLRPAKFSGPRAWRLMCRHRQPAPAVARLRRGNLPKVGTFPVPALPLVRGDLLQDLRLGPIYAAYGGPATLQSKDLQNIEHTPAFTSPHN